MNGFLAWLRQGTTQTGVTLVATTALGYAGGSLPLPVALTTLAAGLAGLAWPEDTALKQDVQRLVQDALAVADDVQAARGVSVAKSADVGTHLGAAALLLIAGSTAACSAAQEQRAQQIADVACKIQTVGGPVIVAVTGALAPQAAPFATVGVDVATQICARLHGTPTATTPPAAGSQPPVTVAAPGAPA